MCQPCFSLSHSRLTIPFAPLRRPTCSAYPPSSLFSSLLSQKPCTPLHASLLTSTSTSWPSVSMARTGMLACRIRGRLVSVVQKSGYHFFFSCFVQRIRTCPTFHLLPLSFRGWFIGYFLLYFHPLPSATCGTGCNPFYDSREELAVLGPGAFFTRLICITRVVRFIALPYFRRKRRVQYSEVASVAHTLTRSHYRQR